MGSRGFGELKSAMLPVTANKVGSDPIGPLVKRLPGFCDDQGALS
jgi:hypothetical protein